MDLSFRSIEKKDFKGIFKRIKKDFAPGEYPPYFVLNAQLQKGIQNGLLLVDGGAERAYAVCADTCENGFVLISLLAVYKEYRGQGYGPLLLDHIVKSYACKKGVIAEVEKPEEAETKEERRIREKRMAFYEKAGFWQIPGVRYSIWDVPMHLMAYAASAPAAQIRTDIGPIMYDIYHQLMGSLFIHKMQIEINH